MRASAGDRIIIVRAGPHEPIRVTSPDGKPPYLVRWFDTGWESLIFPGPDARIVHYGHEAGPIHRGPV
ncbi:DUF1918 domain-containing protein [Actinomadura rugatobispora]|uniref:DUF1918 domain-containing protein n=1 Tax=Actinomadura rugatobispora TaxID=1994 RepID=A0ABW1A2S3_9ACTN|nr:hypothetical protein GCM10010200_106280 [Actinomadura rugatobispora]